MDAAFAAAARGAPHGTLVIAEEQTAGRGRHGRSWTSAPGESLTFSLLLRPRLPLAVVPLLPLVTGLAVRQAVAARVSAMASVKWPNDVLVSGRKIAGVLVESRVKGDEVKPLVVGVGLNVETRAFSPSLSPMATSLALAGATDRGREAWLLDCLTELVARLDLLEQGAVDPIVSELGSHDALRGRWLSAGAIRGVGAGIDSTGALLVRTEDHRTVAVTSGMVELEGAFSDE
ncbi:MAG: biotin--[acetyl-CoA-carboxylase] ligase [Polyangiaceae bacterium]|nr:biotin--[acetyl-CoA-carboxylase] ligase [Polyangiaceae bacterium]